jgi:2-deoxy-D-gluconate 3-dehydrogenase
MIFEKFRLDGKIAVVTGGTQGLGKAIAIALAEAGSDIAVVSRNPNLEVEESMNSLGRKYFHYSADLSRRNDTYNVIPSIIREMGDIDILINNAGVIRRSPVIDYLEEDWDTTLEIDLTAVFLLSQAAGRIMLKKGKGKIINVASVLAYQGGINVIGYVAAKHGVVGITKALSNEWASRGVNVNAIAPSFFVTKFTEAIQRDPERYKSIIGRTPAGRWGVPEDIAGAAVFLASPASDFIHGVIIPVDGGWIGW